MKKKKLHITIGIPAYNEEANIGNLLNDINKQKNDNFIISQIIVVSDNSTDKTNMIVKRSKLKEVKLIINHKRLGQALSQNKIVENFNSDILVLLNADIRITDIQFLNKIIHPFYKDKINGLVSPKTMPVSAQTFFEKVINYSISFKDELYTSLSNKNNIYFCRGTARAFSKELVRLMQWKKMIAEDAYSYLIAIQNGLKFVYVPKAIIYYKSPSNFQDHYKQSNRFIQGNIELQSFFPRKLLEKEFHIDKKTALRVVIRRIFLSPVYMISYIVILLRVKITKNTRVTPTWDIATSSKSFNV